MRNNEIYAEEQCVKIQPETNLTFDLLHRWRFRPPDRRGGPHYRSVQYGSGQRHVMPEVVVGGRRPGGAAGRGWMGACGPVADLRPRGTSEPEGCVIVSSVGDLRPWSASCWCGPFYWKRGENKNFQLRIQFNSGAEARALECESKRMF